MISVLIPAAGSGLRMGSTEPKALVPVAGRPMLLWCIEALAAVRGVAEILVAAPPDMVDRFEKLRAENQGSLWREVVSGGATRMASVRNLVTRARRPRVMVHDAARPCVTAPWVSALLTQLGADRAGVPAIPVRDTLKRGVGGHVVETISRNGLYIAQTPQIFDTDLLRRAHEAAAGGADDATDDAALVEAIGEKVRLLTGEPSNVKVTYPDDVVLAGLILSARRGRQ